MSDLIDRKKLIEYLDGEDLTYIEDFYNAIRRAPAVDAVEVPTFKDVFLKAFPKADLEDGDDGNSLICRNVVFFGRALCSQFPICSECWSQPYFEEEGEGE